MARRKGLAKLRQGRRQSGDERIMIPILAALLANTGDRWGDLESIRNHIGVDDLELYFGGEPKLVVIAAYGSGAMGPRDEPLHEGVERVDRRGSECAAIEPDKVLEVIEAGLGMVSATLIDEDVENAVAYLRREVSQA